MQKISEGCFIMGSEEGFGDEKPRHKVCLSDYLIDTCETTQKQFKNVKKPEYCKSTSLIDLNYSELIHRTTDFFYYKLLTFVVNDENPLTDSLKILDVNEDLVARNIMSRFLNMNLIQRTMNFDFEN